jgi:predicted ATPase
MKRLIYTEKAKETSAQQNTDQMKTYKKTACADGLGTTAQTNWCVITGAPCSGKTSVIEGLADRGHRVVHEVARAFIDKQLAKGVTLSEIKADILAFERQILIEKVHIENKLPKPRLIFLDRAVPDSIAYFQIEGLDIAEPLEYSQSVRYHKIFLFERLTYEKDPVRSENQSLAIRIERLLNKCYAMLGYEVIRVPVLAVDQRIDFILMHCNSRD